MDPAEVFELNMMSLQEPMKRAALRGDSEIQQFYENSVVFVTGGTGFMGKLLIEKLFRICNVRKIFLLTRQKKGKSSEDRLKTVLEDPVFNVLREAEPKFAERITVVGGDASELRLGLDDHDWAAITTEVEIVFHLAATTRFDEYLRLATFINVRGTREALNLAKSCSKLRSYVHVSTAYSHATSDKIESSVREQFYPSPVSPEVLIQLVETMEESRLNDITERLIDGWPNTYSFTKAVSEELVQQMAGDMPICIVRPSIVISAYCDPSPGWLDTSCVFTVSGLFLSIILGINHVILTRNVKLSLVPADYVNNALLAAGCETSRRRQDGDKTLKIYTVSVARTRFRWDILTRVSRSARARSFASPQAINYAFLLETSNRFVFWLLTWLVHYIPGYLADAAYFLLRLSKPQQLPSFVYLYTKLYKASMGFSYFLMNEFILTDDNTSALYNSLSPTDKDLFNFDVMTIDFEQLILTWGIGIRKYIIKDGLKNSAYGVKKQHWFKIATFTFLFIYIFVFIMIFYLLYTNINHVMYK